jgi:hypothetical protein
MRFNKEYNSDGQLGPFSAVIDLEGVQEDFNEEEARPEFKNAPDGLNVPDSTGLPTSTDAENIYLFMDTVNMQC